MNAQTLRGVTVVHQDSFEDYVRASGPRLKRLAFLLTGDLNEAEDLLQSAYAKAMPHWSRISGYDVPDAYMRRVMVSIRTSWWRRSRGRETLVPEIPERGAGPASLTDAVVDSQVLLAALRALPDRQRAAVVLRHWCDLSEAETALTMGCSVGTVKSTTSKGLARLRAGLAVNVPLKGEASS
jgi:RNA polymerase sigma-70 factor (sigma-E family)